MYVHTVRAPWRNTQATVPGTAVTHNTQHCTTQQYFRAYFLFAVFVVVRTFVFSDDCPKTQNARRSRAWVETRPAQGLGLVSGLGWVDASTRFDLKNILKQTRSTITEVALLG